MRVASVLRAAIVFFSWWPLVAVAQSDSAEVPSDADSSPQLPAGGVVVEKDQVRAYRSLLLDEVYQLVGRGEFAFVAAKAPQFVERFRDSAAAAENLGISASGEVVPAPLTPIRGLLFAQGGSTAHSVATNESDSAFRLLWNTTTSLWRHGYAKADLSLVLFREGLSGGRQVRWQLERMYPAALGKYPGTLTPLFREKISASLPAVLDGLRWLTIRSLGVTPDYLWAASPITGNVRQMTGSNRGDEVFSGAFAPDDLFVWSGKVELVKPQRLTEQTLLVPFVTQVLARNSGDATCESRAPQSGALLELNQTTNRFAQARGWVPTNVTMAPRQVVRIDLTLSDPLSADASMTVIIDRESQLPVYKIVWGRDGRVRTLVMGVVGAISREGAFQPLTVGHILVRPLNDERAVLMLDTLTTCRSLPTGVTFLDFDPSRIGHHSSPAGAQRTPSSAATGISTEEALD
jgi:hypothetical protein